MDDEDVEVKENDEGIDTKVTSTGPNLSVLKVMVDALALRDFVKAVGFLSDEIKMLISDDGIKVAVVDPSHVCLVDLSFSPDMFEELQIEETRAVGIDIGELKSILKLAKQTKKDSDIITLDFVDKGKYQVGYHDGDFPLLEADGMSDPKVPDLNFETEWKVRIKELAEFLKKAGDVSDCVAITVTDAEVKFLAEGDRGKARLVLPKWSDALPELTARQGARTIFNLEWLAHLVKAMKGSTEYAVFRTSTNYPMRVDYEVQDGRGKVTFMLAPRLENA